MPINQNTNLSALTTIPQLTNALSALLPNIQQTVNGLTLNDLNITVANAYFSSITPSINITHNLGYIPNGYFPIIMTSPGMIYGASFTINNAFLSAAGLGLSGAITGQGISALIVFF